MAKFTSDTLIIGVFGLLLTGCSPSAQFAALSAPQAAAELGIAAADAADIETAEAELPPAEITEEADVAPVAMLAYSNVEAGADNNQINALINKYALAYNVPASLVHRVVKRESTYNPNARNGIHRGLMQLNPATARTMGFRGDNQALFDADTNLKYGVKYLAGAWLVSDGNADRADKLYQSGYYYLAKRKGLLKATGLRN